MLLNIYIVNNFVNNSVKKFVNIKKGCIFAPY